ncbi:TetR family transcriptional regulator [Sandaracinus amylolyticus]|nr:TetR family transcriptional regulator [Sandaracinus amylolyticus]
MAVKRAPKERPGPPGGKRDVNRKQRTQAIAHAALALFLEKGVEAVTIDDIAREADVAKGSFYRYFEDKTELVDAIFEPVSTLVRAAMQRCEDALSAANDRDSLFQAYQGLARDLIPVAVGYLDVVRLYLQENRAPGHGARAPIRALALDIEKSAVKLTEIAVQKELLRVSDPRISALAVVGATEQLALGFLHGRLDAPPPQVASTLIDLVLEGLRIRR